MPFPRRLLSLVLAAFPLSFSPAYAEVSENDADQLLKAVQEQSERLARQERDIQMQRQELERQNKMLMQERTRFNQLKSQVSQITGKSIPDASTAANGEPPEHRVQTAGGADIPAEVGTDKKPVEKEKPPEIAALIDEGGVLLQQGALVVTPGIEYSRSSATRVAIEGFSYVPAINIGLFEVSNVDRDTLVGSVGLRYGITNRIEVDTKIPYVYRSDSTLSRPILTPSSGEVRSDVDGYDIGDVEFGAHYQINKGQDGWPYLVGNLRFKTATGTSPFDVPLDNLGLQTELPTGSGFYALQPSITAIFPSDPVVFYSNIGYLHNFSKDFGGTIGEIEPGDGISASFGMSLSLNDKASFSVGYSHNTIFETKQNGQSLPNSDILQVGSLDLGYSYNLTPRTNLNFQVSAGVTDDAPDSRVIFRVPMKFDMK